MTIFLTPSCFLLTSPSFRNNSITTINQGKENSVHLIAVTSVDAQLCKEPWRQISDINLVVFVVCTAFLLSNFTQKTSVYSNKCCRPFRVMENPPANVFLDSFSHQWCQSRLFSMPVTVPPQPTHNTVCSRFLSLIFSLVHYL